MGAGARCLPASSASPACCCSSSGTTSCNLAGWETLLLFGAGAALVAVELVFFPGHGVMVVLGVVLAVLALTESMVDVKRVPLDVSWSLGWLPRR